jgi:hypothetical protein
MARALTEHACPDREWAAFIVGKMFKKYFCGRGATLEISPAQGAGCGLQNETVLKGRGKSGVLSGRRNLFGARPATS